MPQEILARYADLTGRAGRRSAAGLHHCVAPRLSGCRRIVYRVTATTIEVVALGPSHDLRGDLAPRAPPPFGVLRPHPLFTPLRLLLDDNRQFDDDVTVHTYEPQRFAE